MIYPMHICRKTLINRIQAAEKMRLLSAPTVTAELVQSIGIWFISSEALAVPIPAAQTARLREDKLQMRHHAQLR